ncbi:hypothetical protein IP92_01635 [Pseudoduganella flava]|uniref:Uncharacterized protein n=1 Tax=Pseudoduganella flava TaxID=871742 RepID=A0A562Q245_9BURK|nr:hypothetical protein [Pseudoduganella flava]QGZ38082.1 hypothetical protein GO485_02810 [Pseudoduganella flava]TWI50406.1 hypothetical protein IP92_01635 [Pseudoduganella flava]
MTTRTWDYDTITASTLRTLTAIATDARQAGPETAEPRWAMAAGVLRGWCDLMGDDAKDEDRAMMEELFEGMPLPPEHEDCGDGTGPGWHFSSVLVLRPARPRTA